MLTTRLLARRALRPRALLHRRRPMSSSNPPPPPETTTTTTKTISRADRILARLPASLQKHTGRLRRAPLSHVVAFLVLHEITAVVPLLGLFGLFHYTDYVPIAWMMQHYGAYVRDGVAKFEKYFGKKGWFGFAPGEHPGEHAQCDDEAIMDRWQGRDAKYKIVVEVALAYGITKVLLPVRILGTVWGTPWFASLLSRLRGLFTSRSGRQR